MPADRSNDTLRKVIDLTYEMLELADHGDAFRSDAGCGVVFGTLRDSAYKIRQLATRELSEHDFPPSRTIGKQQQSDTPEDVNIKKRGKANEQEYSCRG